MSANTVTPGSAFCPNYQPVADWSDCRVLSNGLTRRQTATKEREKQLALGNTGTMYGISKLSDEQIARTGRVRKPSALG